MNNPGAELNETQTATALNVLNLINERIAEGPHTPDILRLAEAFAWIKHPNQPHGTHAKTEQ